MVAGNTGYCELCIDLNWDPAQIVGYDGLFFDGILYMKVYCNIFRISSRCGRACSYAQTINRSSLSCP